ncbi:MAG: class I SAM-dependent methyltransferase, partial [Nitrospirae bacterium]|nr:class I SAM-dependent methyltransferase [Nitrospirota bacterium]
TSGEVWLTDINGSMLAEGRDRMLDAGLTLPLAQCDAEKLPFPSGHFDLVSVAFGLRNMTHKDVALAEMARALRPGGRLLVLEFSRIWQPLGPLYDAYSFNVLPWLGKKLAGDSDGLRQNMEQYIEQLEKVDAVAPKILREGMELIERMEHISADCIGRVHKGLRNARLNAASRPVVSEGGKTGGNELCPCGSGRKFKRCCGLTH